MEHAVPRFLSRLFRRLFTGSLGEEVCDELEQEYLYRRVTKGTGRGFLWYAGHLLAPGTWILAIKLRQRSGRSRPAIPFSALDFKLGLRMLVRYPGLTIIGGLAMAFAIMAGAATFEFINQMVRPTLPLMKVDAWWGSRAPAVGDHAPG